MEQGNVKKSRRRFDQQFKVDAVRLLTESGKTVSEVARNLSAIHTVASLSRGLGLSRETLRESFARTEKVTLRHYIASIRVEEMKELLRNTSLSCMAVCLELSCREDVGARLFKQHMGIVMQEFRDGQQFSPQKG